jgi:hypothetical protein
MLRVLGNSFFVVGGKKMKQFEITQKPVKNFAFQREEECR